MSKILSITLLTLMAMNMGGCSGVSSDEYGSLASTEKFSKPLSTPFPDTIHYPHGMPSEEEIALGRSLFFDKRLTADAKLACASCHQPGKGFSNGLKADKSAASGGTHPRNPPHLYNLAWMPFLYWDGRAESLEDQAAMAFSNPAELAQADAKSVVDRLAAIPSYQSWFKRVFPDKGLELATVTRALASFERSLISNNSPFDQYLNGNHSAMSAGAVRGLALFQGKALCHNCHHGSNLTDGEFHNTGVSTDDPGFHNKDRQGPKELGFTPYPFFVTSNAFKTPGLRNVALTAPYFHDGSASTLDEVVDFYDKGSRTPQARGLALHIRSLSLSLEEKRDLVEFMQNLTSLVEPGTPRIP